MDGGEAKLERPEKTVSPLFLVILLVVFLLAIIAGSITVIILAPKWKLARAEKTYASVNVGEEDLDESGFYKDDSESRPLRNVISSENIADGISLYDSLISNATTDAEKAGYYLDRAAELYTKDKTAYAAQILSDAHAAEEIYKTAYSAERVAFYEIRLGSEDEGKKYYCIAYERNPGYAFDLCGDNDEEELWQL